MGHARRAGAFQTFSIAVAAGAAVLTVLLVAPAVAAPGKGAELLASGVKSLEAGKPADAVTTLTSALSSGSLDSAGMAKALYYRGLAQRRQGRPAQAIADLTNAMWIKGGLTEAERADATERRWPGRGGKGWLDAVVIWVRCGPAAMDDPRRVRVAEQQCRRHSAGDASR